MGGGSDVGTLPPGETTLSSCCTHLHTLPTPLCSSHSHHPNLPSCFANFEVQMVWILFHCSGLGHGRCHPDFICENGRNAGLNLSWRNLCFNWHIMSTLLQLAYNVNRSDTSSVNSSSSLAWQTFPRGQQPQWNVSLKFQLKWIEAGWVLSESFIAKNMIDSRQQLLLWSYDRMIIWYDHMIVWSYDQPVAGAAVAVRQQRHGA